jgi:hypothetical protein
LPAIPSHAEAKDAPAPAPALDAAIDASIELLKRQQPKLRELKESARGALRGIRPALEAMKRGFARMGSAMAPAGRTIGNLFGEHGRRVAQWSRRALTSRGSTVSMASAFIIAVAVLTFSAFRRTSGAARSDSRCPTEAAMDGKRPFGVLLDSLGTAPQGSDLVVHYDVCGLEKGTPYKVKMSIVREGRGHAADRMTANFDDSSTGIGMRRQHMLAVAPLPAGSYRLTVVVTDDRGRKRDRDLPVKIVDK